MINYTLNKLKTLEEYFADMLEEPNKYLNIMRLMFDDKYIIKGLLNKYFQDFDFYKYFKDNAFVTAFLDLYFFSEYDHKIMSSRLEKSRHFLSGKFKDKHDALNTLTRLYSYGVVKNKIYYDSNTKKLYVPKSN